MCGILVAFLPKTTSNPFRTSEPPSEPPDTQQSKNPNERFKSALQTLKQRGPDSTTITFTKYAAFGKNRHYTSSHRSVKNNWTYVLDGCIDTDLGRLLDIHGTEAPRFCKGSFAFVAYHPIVGMVVARDLMGISPLYVGITSTPNGTETWFASEMKALLHCDWSNCFPSGTVYNGTYSILSPPPVQNGGLFDVLRSVVEQQLRVDVPWGVLLSGGTHSSIVASITRFCTRPKGYPVLHTFTIGLAGSRNIVAARSIANELNAIHHEVLFTPEEGIAQITNTIAAIESADKITVQKSVPLYILAKHIRKCGVKVVLTGLGAEEIFSSSNKLYTKCITNKCMASQGVTSRVPFLDTSIVHLANTRMHPTNLKHFFNDCVPRDVLSSTTNRIWVRACEMYGEHKYTLIFNTLYPKHI